MDDVLDRILMPENIRAAIKEVKENNGAPGIDQMPVDELNAYFALNESVIVRQILNKEYKPQPVRRVYIPKPNSDKSGRWAYPRLWTELSSRWSQEY